MGYTTEFTGKFKIYPELSDSHKAYLDLFCNIRHMQRNPKVLETMPDPIREAVGLPLGVDGEFFTGGEGYAGQDKEPSILNYNEAPGSCPGLWCQWISENGKDLRWDGGEKFYDYEEWLSFMITQLFQPWGYTLNGAIRWKGESRGDKGILEVKNNILTSLEGESMEEWLANQKRIRQAKIEQKNLDTVLPKVSSDDNLNKPFRI